MKTTKATKVEGSPAADSADGAAAKPVSFRPPPALEQALARAAAARGESKGECAKRLDIAAALGDAGDKGVSDADRDAGVRQAVTELGEEVARLKELIRDAREEGARQAERLEKRLTHAARFAQAIRDDLATLAVALLTTAGGQDAAAAEAWVRRELGRPAAPAEDAAKEGRGR